MKERRYEKAGEELQTIIKLARNATVITSKAETKGRNILEEKDGNAKQTRGERIQITIRIQITVSG